jgi:hypothetical protein
MIEAGIRRVVGAIKDLDPRVHGGDLHRFCAAVIEGLLDLGAGAAATYAGLLHRLNSGGPRLIRARTGARWAEARIGRRSNMSLGVRRQGRSVRAVFPSVDVSPQQRRHRLEHWRGRSHGLLGRLGPLGLTKVAVHPDDPFAAALDHPMGGRAARVIGR